MVSESRSIETIDILSQYLHAKMAVSHKAHEAKKPVPGNKKEERDAVFHSLNMTSKNKEKKKKTRGPGARSPPDGKHDLAPLDSIDFT